MTTRDISRHILDDEQEKILWQTPKIGVGGVRKVRTLDLLMKQPNEVIFGETSESLVKFITKKIME